MLKSISLFVIGALMSINAAFSQNNSEVQKISFKVSGNCEMCKKTIESSLDKKGVNSANWNVESKMMEVVYNPTKISEDQIHQHIASSGYDTEKVKADEKAYKALPGCCQYSRKK